MSTPEPPTAEYPHPQPPPPAPRRRLRAGRFGVLLAVGVLAALVVGGVIGALAFPRTAAAEPVGPRAGHAAGADRPGERMRARAHRAEPARPRPAVGPAIAGTVVSTGNGTLVVAPDGGGPQRTLRTDSSTRVAGGQALTALAPGQRVVVEVTGAGDTATARTVRLPSARILGTVTALNGTVATVTATDGLVSQVDVGTANPRPAVGDLIAASGPVRGTTIAADRVRILPKAS